MHIFFKYKMPLSEAFLELHSRDLHFFNSIGLTGRPPI